MELRGFSLGDDFISLMREGVRLDLHNDYQFQELRHRPRERSIILAWSRRTSEWTSHALPQTVELQFQDVYFFKVAERDSALPATEDDCVNMLGFLWNDLREEMNGCAKIVPEPECSHFVVVFQGGSAVKLGAKAVGLAVPAGA